MVSSLVSPLLFEDAPSLDLIKFFSPTEEAAKNLFAFNVAEVESPEDVVRPTIPGRHDSIQASTRETTGSDHRYRGSR